MFKLKNNHAKIYFCDGNHDDHQSLSSLNNSEIYPNVYLNRGSLFKLPNSKTVLFMGGAESIDKQKRTLGVDWFREEVIGNKYFLNLPLEGTRVDMVISHTCPIEFEVTESIYCIALILLE